MFCREPVDVKINERTVSFHTTRYIVGERQSCLFVFFTPLFVASIDSQQRKDLLSKIVN